MNSSSPTSQLYRLDELLFQKGLAVSRTAAQRLIEDQTVYLLEQQSNSNLPRRTLLTKASRKFSFDTQFEVISQENWVSRGAKKLLGAIEAFHPEIKGKTCLDLGASTGGFTQVLLANGATKVFAVDVGTDQLHPTLRQNSRVVVMERTNARELNHTLIPQPIDFLTGDLSFISLTKVLPAVVPLLAPHFTAILLIKPQFECDSKTDLGSGGIVRSDDLRQKAVRKICDFCQQDLGWTLQGVVPSPILGGDGNVEYLGAFYR